MATPEEVETLKTQTAQLREQNEALHAVIPQILTSWKFLFVF